MVNNKSDYRKRDSGDAGRCLKVYAKKRRYHGKKKSHSTANDIGVEETITGVDQPTNDNVALPDPVQTASSSKVVDIDSPIHQIATSIPSGGYRLIDITILANVFAQLSCPGCHATTTLEFNDTDSKKKGLARHFTLKCTACLYEHNFYSSRQVDPPDENKGGQKLFDINVRTVYGCRQVGAGH